MELRVPPASTPLIPAKTVATAVTRGPTGPAARQDRQVRPGFCSCLPTTVVREPAVQPVSAVTAETAALVARAGPRRRRALSAVMAAPVVGAERPRPVLPGPVAPVGSVAMATAGRLPQARAAHSAAMVAPVVAAVPRQPVPRALAAPVVRAVSAVRAAPVPLPVSEVALATAVMAAGAVTAVRQQPAPTVSGVLVVLRAVVAMVVVVVLAMRTVAVRWSMGVLVVPGVLPVVRVSVVRVSLRVWSGRPVMVVPVVMVAMARTWLIRSLPVAVVARVVSGVRRRPVVVVSAGTAAPAEPGSPMRCRRQARRAPMAVRVAAVETVVGRRRVWAAGAVMPAPVVPVVRAPMGRPVRLMGVTVVPAVQPVPPVLAG